jgi:hypothetical protein
VVASPDDFFATLDRRQITCVYVHGNRMSAADASRQGLTAFQRLAGGNLPVRFVIWSWPSDRVHGALRDVRIKAARSDAEALYLARFLARIPAGEMPVSLIGYSYGARTVTGGLQLLAGGRSGGRRLDDPPAETVHPRVVLFASAFPNGWITPDSVHGRAFDTADQVLSLYNPYDPVLKLYRFTADNGKPVALGHRGISSRALGPYAPRVEQRDVGSLVGHSHDFDRYTSTTWVQRRVRNYVLWSELQ